MKLSRWERLQMEKRQAQGRYKHDLRDAFNCMCGKPPASGPCSPCKECHAKMVTKLTAQMGLLRATMDRK